MQQTDVQGVHLKSSIKMFERKHLNSAATAQASNACNIETEPVHLGTMEFGRVDKTSVEATQLVPLSKPSNGHKVQKNSQEIMYYCCFRHNV